MHCYFIYLLFLDILPLSTTTHRKIALVGPHGQAQGAMQGNYKVKKHNHLIIHYTLIF